MAVFKDITFPKNNEQKFIDVAERLHTKELYLIYPFQKTMGDLKQKVEQFQTVTKVKLHFGIFAKPSEIGKAKNICNFIITESSEKNQHVLEKLRPDTIFDLENSHKKDKSHYRLSGLNQVLCKLATKNSITIAFSFSALLKATPERRATLLGRIRQNITFCKKYKTPFIIASFAKTPYEMRSKEELQSLLTSLRAS